MAKYKARRSVFDNQSLEDVTGILIEEIIDLYQSDSTPWVVGYSGGKDSTATLQLVWMAIEKMGAKLAKKPVHVISTDTLVENPIVASWVANSLEKINATAKLKKLPIQAHRLLPALTDSFWVNLLGKGYSAPRQKFRWCTSRLKINPSHKFISAMVDKHGETILVLGTRIAESKARARTMKRHAQKRTKARLSPNASLRNSMIYSPIEDWSNDDVWMFILETRNPWGHENMDLFEMYKGASEDGECPLVVSSNTPSCGDSRFGCWVCTLVEKDKSMQAMIRNNEDKAWMLPLLEIRNEIDFRNMPEGGDKHMRDFRRMRGNVQLFNGKPIPGPYKQQVRENILAKLLRTQTQLQENGPTEFKSLELIRLEELEEIRRIWVVEKHELEDSLPGIYEAATGYKYPGKAVDESTQFSKDDLKILSELTAGNAFQYEMIRELLSIETKSKNVLRRKNIYADLKKAIERNFYHDEADAVGFARNKEQLREMMGSSLQDKKTIAISLKR